MDALTEPVAAGSLSAAAREVLGALAACTWSGPHRARPLRRWTRLTPAAFDEALGELARTGMVRLQREDVFWVTEAGESWARRIYG